MYRFFAILSLILLVACDGEDKEASRKVVSLTSPDGHAFQFMPIYEDGVSDITVRVAWPSNWARTDGVNPAVPYVGADLILSGGTEALKPQDVLEKFEDMNAYGNLAAGPDYVFGELGFPREHIDEATAIASEMLANPQLNDAWMERIKQGFSANQAEMKAFSGNQMWSVSRKVVLGDTALFDALDLPDLDAIASITRDDIFQWHAATFTNAPSAVVVTGAISEEDAGRVVDTVLGGLPEATATERSPDQADFAPVSILLHLPEAEKTSIAFIGQLPPTRDGGDPTDLIALNLLGGANGPLFEAIRTELRATYGMQVGVANYTRDMRFLYMTGEVEAAQLGQVRDVVSQTYDGFRQTPNLTGLAEVRGRISGGTKENVQFVDIAAQVIMEMALDGHDVTDAPNLHTLFDAVTDDMVKARLLEVFPAASDMMVFAVSPDATALPGACVITSVADAMSCR